MKTARIRLNGQDEPLCFATVADLVADKAIDLSHRGIAVALNGVVVPRLKWAETVVKPGDDVEIVRAMQGG
jgi:sulfur carrier protein